jgi:hypothetical protein
VNWSNPNFYTQVLNFKKSHYPLDSSVAMIRALELQDHFLLDTTSTGNLYIGTTYITHIKYLRSYWMR